jgi:hypothetical protein
MSTVIEDWITFKVSIILIFNQKTLLKVHEKHTLGKRQRRNMIEISTEN